MVIPLCEAYVWLIFAEAVSVGFIVLVVVWLPDTVAGVAVGKEESVAVTAEEEVAEPRGVADKLFNIDSVRRELVDGDTL